MDYLSKEEARGGRRDRGEGEIHFELKYFETLNVGLLALRKPNEYEANSKIDQASMQSDEFHYGMCVCHYGLFLCQVR